jgi:hypothetical protein
LGFLETTRYYRHARDLDAMHWEEITDEKEKETLASRARGEQDAEAAILKHIPVTAPIERALLIDKVNCATGIGVNRLATILRGLLNAPSPKIHAWHIKRPRTNPVTCIWTQAQG